MVGLLLSSSAAAQANERVCNEYFCNDTIGSGLNISSVIATKIGLNRGSIGFFEAFGPNGQKSVGPTGTPDQTGFPVAGRASKGDLVCVRYFVKILSTGKFKELGSAACTKAPW